MRRTRGVVLGLAMLTVGAVMPAAAQEAEERETVRDLLRLLADARAGDPWTAALQPHPVARLDSLLRRHGLDLRGQDPREAHGGTSARPRRERFALTKRRDPPALIGTLRLEEAVRRMERDIERWILRAASGSGGDGAAVAGGAEAPPAPAASPPPGADGTSAEPPGGGGRPR